MSQENVSDKVRNLQRQIAQGIKFGQRPPSLRKSEGDEGSSDEEEVPRSPLKVLAQVESEPANTETKVQGGAQHAEPHSTPVKSPRSKRVLPPTGTIESINLDAVPQSVPRLDNTAAKHKLAVKPKNQRVSRKHRRFTQDFQEVSIPGVLQEELEAAGVSSEEQRRASVESLDGFKKQRLHEEERQETRRRRRELEEQRLKWEEEEEKRKRVTEELRLRELEEERCRKQREEEEQRLRREEEERRMRAEEERRQREEEERRMREEQERRQREEEERRRLEEQRRKDEEERKRREEEEEEVRRQLEKRRRQREEEEERKKKEEGEKLRLQEIEEKKKQEAEERRRREEEEQRRLSMEEEADGCSDPLERKRRAEELRWKEMEERQRPFSFKVSSGEKQILFQKVNLTPVTPASSQQGGAAAEQRESTKGSSSSEGADSPNLPTSPYVPHTAILVTGAQLCGTAVNLDQIKDTACKSLLGLGEDRKAQGTPPTKSKTSPDRKSGKTKSLNESSSLSTDQSGSAVLAEWASIRSKIFKGVEEGKYDEHEPGKQPGAEEQPAFSHANLRKTMSASAKFSITPAKKKFGDSNRNSEVFGAEEAVDEVAPSETPPPPPPPASRPQSRTSKTVRIVERGSEECMFAKDLPSFLVPSPGAKPEGSELKSRAKSETEAGEGADGGGQDGEDNPSPFGIKLRRTNFSLRFHSEQSTEKRKKRYSAGDSFDGVPSPLTPIEPDSDTSSVFSEKSSPTSPQKEGAVGKYSHASASPAFPRGKTGKSTSSPPAHVNTEKVVSKPPFYRRPTTSPKPVPTPPPSPLPKVSPGPPGDVLTQRTGAAESSGQEPTRSEEASAITRISPVQGEEEPKEKRSFFPSINIPWREKTDRKTELIKKEKPSLQSRHSLDSSRVQDKEAGPLWITLALQKQKGFREQQQNRDERRSQREAKQAEKHTRDSVALLSPTESRGSGSTSPSSKPQTPEEPKRPDSLLGRFERREQLKKASTLPSSVTVEITDSTPSPPAVKEVSKRFPSTDSPQVSTEPAWLALAKRKAKAWSDCPQIIK
ncbi:capping protein inhibiting regulator of actin dynamics isoform X1 [Labrus mixtus]|uniref:capping protein inhibiting regulator of actin dynamics isoform X1 n=1 Tax=Labrus mixtus TaxID=508554 RepID=UPI0029BFA955|nr:capping protein inhibiting regulator of actin dynamics isoform X1 [Labrus mixtus]XP_060884747.1 capping protein inhibiting regulator of actin dynamics isoform X1 [Labrus mixtus]